MNEISRIDPATPAAQPGSMLAVIVAAATNPAVDVAKLKELMAMQERLEERQATRTFNQALARVTREMPRVAKNGTIELGGKGSIPFAKWEDMDEMIRPRMEAEGFTLSFDSSIRDGGGAVISGTLLHEDGHSRTVSIPLPRDSGPGRNNLQALGSTLSYGKRYCTEMLFNIVREGADDDGRSGGARYITEDQALAIETLITETKSNRVDFMRHFEINSILEMRVEQHTAALNMLNTKKVRLGKGAQP